MNVKNFFFAFLLFFSLASPVVAHELLPADLQKFIKGHPQATTAEIQEFIAVHSTRTSLSVVNTIAPAAVAERGFLDNIGEFVKLGFRHILSGPDHILFVLSFLLSWVSIREILKLTGTFTVAHSMTFILAGSGFLFLSSRVVEPLIALSISYVALMSVFGNKKILPLFMRRKIPAVFFFGLFHGLGFAGLLADLNIPADRFLSSLISFNIGIEFGQVFVVLLVLPFILGFKNRSWYPTAEKIVASIIATVGLYWFVVRLIG